MLELLLVGEVYLPLPPPSRTPCQPNAHLRGQGRTDAHNVLKTLVQRGCFPFEGATLHLRGQGRTDVTFKGLHAVPLKR